MSTPGRKIEVEAMFAPGVTDYPTKTRPGGGCAMCGFLLTPDVRGSGLVHSAMMSSPDEFIPDGDGQVSDAGMSVENVPTVVDLFH